MREKKLQVLGIVLLLFCVASYSCSGDSDGTSSSQSASNSTSNFSITGQFPQCQMDSISLYTADGLGMKTLFSEAIQKKGDSYRFNMEGNVPQEGFYFLGQAPNNLTVIILGNEKGIEVEGNCMNLRTYAKINNSPANELFKKVNSRMLGLQQRIQNASRQMASSPNQEQFRNLIQVAHQEQIALKDSLLTASPLLGKVAALQIFKPFDPGNNPEGYSNPVEHFANTFLAHADLSDPVYNKVLPLSDQVQSFVQTLFSAGLEQEVAEKALDGLLAKIPKGSEAHKNVLAMTISLMEQMGNIGFVKYSQLYMGSYEVDEAMRTTINNRMEFITLAEKQRLEKEKLFGIGATPPDISLPTPEGQNLSLRSLKGKVVLLDFWASWCGPCRRENPNVVRAYNKYKDKGFTVYSVSLDRSKPPWLKAIQQDNMTWHHVSDLKYFNSQAARDYNIQAIPATFLLDRNGKIIGKNLRGPALEAKLKTVLN